MKKQKFVVSVLVLAFLSNPATGMFSRPNVALSGTHKAHVEDLAQQLPDLVITGVWNEDGDICYQVRNIGDSVALKGHYTALSIDGQQIATDLVNVELAVGERLNRCFGVGWQCSPPKDTIEVCADLQDSVTESDETNNCTEEAWLCDTAPPEITFGPTASQIGETSATISWTTDEDSDSLVEFGKQAGEFESQEADTALVQSHEMVLTGLYPATTYHYVVESADVSGNTVVSGDHFFRTALPADGIAPEFSFFGGMSRGVRAEFTASATDNVAMHKMEFSFDGEQMMIDYDAPYQWYLDPADLDIPRGDFFSDHTIKAVAFDEFGSTDTGTLFHAPDFSCAGGFLELLEPEVGYSILADGGVVPAGTIVRIEADASFTPWVDHPFLPDSPMERVEFWVGDTRVYSSTEPIITHSLDWDAGGLEAGEHTVRVRGYLGDGCWKMDAHRLNVVETMPRLRVTNRSFAGHTVSLTIRNHGEETAYVTTLTDYMSGFQAASQDTGVFSVTASYDPAGDQCQAQLHFYDPLEVPPWGGTAVVRYDAVPVLRPGLDHYRLGPRLGDALGEIEYFDPGGITYTLEFASRREGDYFDLQVGEKIRAADYLIVTNPNNLHPLSPETRQGVMPKQKCIVNKRTAPPQDSQSVGH